MLGVGADSDREPRQELPGTETGPDGIPDRNHRELGQENPRSRLASLAILGHNIQLCLES